MWFKDTLKSLVMDVGVHGALTSLGERAGREMFPVTDDVRAALMAFIRGDVYLDNPDAGNALIARHRATLPPSKGGTARYGEEDRFVNLLSRLFLALKDKPPQQRIDAFVDIGGMDDAEFAQTLVFLENDGFIQLLMKYGQYIRDIARAVGPYLAAGLEITAALARAIADGAKTVAIAIDHAAANTAAPAVGRFADWLEQQPGAVRNAAPQPQPDQPKPRKTFRSLLGFAPKQPKPRGQVNLGLRRRDDDE